MRGILYGRAGAESKPYNLLIADAVQSMRMSLGVTSAELARASGIPGPSIAAIELGGPTTRAERHDIAMAFAWIANNRKGTGPTIEILTTETKRAVPEVR